ncbi:hypothetical protein MKX01_000011 [Papaver californicum]|nr:hypothetical protein MKX01_000011 [Papaver californicum]
MTRITGIGKAASVSFAPDAPYFAAGAIAGALDASFSNTASIEIYKIDFTSGDELPLAGSYPSPSNEPFSRVSWGKAGSGTEQFSLGLIAGGLGDGSIGVWNPLSLINGTDEALVHHLKPHTGPVRGLEFNLHSNLLASGADEGDIHIWDMTNPTEPIHYPPLKSVGSAAQGEIAYLSWNPNQNVHHILASTSYNGSTVVWDLKKQKPAISFRDPSRSRCSVLQWNPAAATQLMLASDDDSSPDLKLWDVRNTMSPVKEFVGHTKGVIAMKWCPTDSRYLLTCGKDSRTFCWDTVSGEIVSELPAGMNFDLHWYSKIPGLVSASSFEGNVGFYNIEGHRRLNAGEAFVDSVNLRAPNWMKCPVGVSFGFGGKLVSCKLSQSTTNPPTGSSEVYIHDLVTELSLVSRSTEFEAAIQDGEKTSLRALCDKKSQESKSEDDREMWGFLKIMFEDDGTARTKLVTHLGFVAQTGEVLEELSQEMNSVNLDDRITDEAGSTVDRSLLPTENAEDFFNNIQSPRADPLPSKSHDTIVGEENLLSNGETIQEELDEQVGSDASSFDDDIRCALVTGNYKGAVSQCIKANRMADALVIAHLGGESLWATTRDQYLKKSNSSYSKVISAMVNKDLTSLVNHRPLDSWKETLALLCSFAERDEWATLCDSLGSRLMTDGRTLAATLCYVCAGNVEKTVEIWSRSLNNELEGRPYVDLLQELMEKTIILVFATGQKRFSAPLSKLVENYAELLASQGLLRTAMEYLKLLGSEETSQELAILQDRISLSIEESEAPKTSQYDNSQPSQESAYVADQSGYGVSSGTQPYYQPQPHEGSSAPYADNYQHQQQFSGPYGGGYSTPSPYQQAPQQAPSPYQHAPQQAPSPYQHAPQQAPQQPHMFLPTQTPQVPSTNFPPAIVAQPTVHSFAPSNPPPLRNVEKYQLAPTLGAQLYPGVANTPYQTVQPSSGPLGSGSVGGGPSQMGSIPGHTISQAPAPIPAQRPFMPGMNNTAAGFSQRPAMGASMQAPSLAQPSQVVAAPAPATPPPTVQTVDTSKVPAHQKPVISTLTRLFNETSEALGGPRAPPAKKRELDDNSKKMGALFAKLNSGDISKNAADKLVQLCVALDNGDFATALQIQVQMTTSEWDECNFWLAALKRMIKTRQSVR